MEVEYLPRHEHEEFSRRQDEHNDRQDARIKELEYWKNAHIALEKLVTELATTSENILKVQESQEKRLKELEGRDGQTWRKVVEVALTVIVGAVVGFALTRLGLQ